MKIDLKANEVVLKATDSDYVLRNVPIAGKLILTNQRIYFKPREETCERFQLEITPAHIREVLPFDRGWFTTSGLNLITKDGRELKFVMKKRNEWGILINKMY